MTGSVRGALSNERPYRDRARGVVSTCELDRARLAHPAIQFRAGRARKLERATLSPHPVRSRQRLRCRRLEG